MATFSSAYDVIRGSSSGDLANDVANAIIRPFDNNSRYFTNDDGSRAIRASARAASNGAVWQMPTSNSEESSPSGYDPTGVYKYYDPDFNPFSAVSAASSPELDEAEKLRRSLSPYSHLYSMDQETAYQEALAATSHQREVADLRAAGLNPVLSAGAGSGASVFSGTYAPVLSTGSGGSSGYSAGSGRDQSSIGAKLSNLNWKSGLPDILSGVAQAGISTAIHNTFGVAYGASTIGRGIGKLFT